MRKQTRILTLHVVFALVLAIWKQVYRNEARTRRANGAQREFEFYSATNASEVWLLLEWDVLYRAELFVKSDELGSALARAGVIGEPDYWYLEDADPELP